MRTVVSLRTPVTIRESRRPRRQTLAAEMITPFQSTSSNRTTEFPLIPAQLHQFFQQGAVLPGS
jgi:hypothetical protein